MSITNRWRKEAGARVQGSRELDSAKVQAPGVVAMPLGGFRLFYTAVGPAKPFRTCQGYILSAVSDDGIEFRKEAGIRVAPQPGVEHMSLRVLAPSVNQCGDGQWRMYFEARGSADRPTVICSAISTDMLNWECEEGIRLQHGRSLGGPRYVPLESGGGRLYCFGSGFDAGESADSGDRAQGVVSAITSDGINFELDDGYRIRSKQGEYDSNGITAAEAVPPAGRGDKWTMFFSAWQDAPPGTVVPVHPSSDANAEADGSSEDFAAASTAVDMAGYRSRIFTAYSDDGLRWERGECVIEGAGYGGEGLDAVHAEDMSVIKIGAGKYRMYYACCDKDGNWRVASAVTQDDGAQD